MITETSRSLLGAVDHPMKLVTSSLMAVRAGRLLKFSHNLDLVCFRVTVDLTEILAGVALSKIDDLVAVRHSLICENQCRETPRQSKVSINIAPELS